MTTLPYYQTNSFTLMDFINMMGGWSRVAYRMTIRTSDTYYDCSRGAQSQEIIKLLDNKMWLAPDLRLDGEIIVFVQD